MILLKGFLLLYFQSHKVLKAVSETLLSRFSQRIVSFFNCASSYKTIHVIKFALKFYSCSTSHTFWYHIGGKKYWLDFQGMSRKNIAWLIILEGYLINRWGWYKQGIKNIYFHQKVYESSIIPFFRLERGWIPNGPSKRKNGFTRNCRWRYSTGMVPSKWGLVLLAEVIIVHEKGQ